MPVFSKKSQDALATCHEDLQKVFNEVIKHFDCSILCGYRDKESQDLAFQMGNSRVEYPKSNHNKNPSFAIDAVPYPVNWSDTKSFYFFAGWVKATAISLKIPLRWGGDFKTFKDLPHFELIDDK